MPTERSPSKLKSEVGELDGDKHRRHRLQDTLPLEISPASDSKQKDKDASQILDSRTNGKSERTDNSNPTAVPRSRSFFQHDDRRSAARDGRHSGRRLTSERGWWKDSKDEGAAHKIAPSDYKEREGKSRAQGGDNHLWRHDRFAEVEADAHPPTKKRRPFREEKLPLEAENVKNAVHDPSKVSRPGSSAVETGRWEERSRDRRPLERNEPDRAYARERSFSNRGRVDNPGFPSRDRVNGLDNDGRYKGRENFGGRRQGYRSNGAQVEKWKHDLYDEANRSPTPKKEEDPVAKVEALLSL